MSDAPKKARRVRYKGTHPKSFAEKYKEHTGDTETAEKIIARGGTPAGTHRPIMVNEILDFLDPSSGKIIIDATLGYGGHTSEILQRLSKSENGKGRLIAFDQDPIERAKTEQRLREQFSTQNFSAIFTLAPTSFANIEAVVKQHGLIGQIDGILADLGLSSMQIDDPTRGFTFKREGPLDLRMNTAIGTPAATLLNNVKLDELTRWLEEYSDEPRAKWCAKAILDRQKKTPILTTTDLATTIRAWMKTLGPKTQELEGDKPIRRAFQALRIAVNDELNALEKLLLACPKILRPRGKIAILSFHSGEDRRVKKSFQKGFRESQYSWISEDPTRPSAEEQRANTRSKSAKLRCAIRS